MRQGKSRLFKMQVRLSLLLLGVSLLLCSCWDQRPIEDLGIIIALCVDPYPANPALLSYTTTHPLFEETKRASAKIATVAAPNLGKMVELWEQQHEKIFAGGKIAVLLLNEEVARQGVQQGLLDYFQTPQLDNNTFVAVTRGTAAELVRTELPESELIGAHIRTFLWSLVRDGYVVRTSLSDMLAYWAAPGIDPVVPILYSPDKQRILLQGAALFQDLTMVGDISLEQLQLLTALQGTSRTVFFTPNIGKTGELASSNIQIKMISPQTRIKPVLDAEGRLHVAVEFSAAFNLDIYDVLHDLSQPGVAEAITRDLEANLTVEIANLLAKLQALQTDPLGVGRKFRLAHWQDYDEAEFREQWAQAQVAVQVKLRNFNIGAVTHSKPKSR